MSPCILEIVFLLLRFLAILGMLQVISNAVSMVLTIGLICSDFHYYNWRLTNEEVERDMEHLLSPSKPTPTQTPIQTPALPSVPSNAHIAILAFACIISGIAIGSLSAFLLYRYVLKRRERRGLQLLDS